MVIKADTPAEDRGTVTLELARRVVYGSDCMDSFPLSLRRLDAPLGAASALPPRGESLRSGTAASPSSDCFGAAVGPKGRGAHAAAVPDASSEASGKHAPLCPSAKAACAGLSDPAVRALAARVIAGHAGGFFDGPRRCGCSLTCGA
ncbi:unnamed protein product [Lampetra planeri]